MAMYHRASKTVKPKLEALNVAQHRLTKAEVCVVYLCLHTSTSILGSVFEGSPFSKRVVAVTSSSCKQGCGSHIACTTRLRLHQAFSRALRSTKQKNLLALINLRLLCCLSCLCVRIRQSVQVCAVVLPQAELSDQTDCLNACRRTLEQLQDTFQSRVAEKTKIEDNAKIARAKMDQVDCRMSVNAGAGQSPWLSHSCVPAS